MGKERSGNVLFAIAIVALVVSAGLIAVKEAPTEDDSTLENWVVGAGDNLTYGVTGYRDRAVVAGTAYANYTIVNITEQGSMVGGMFSTDLGNWSGDWASILGDPLLGSNLGEASIRTDFGTKHITRYVSYHAYPDVNVSDFITVYAGVESRVIYRVNISGPSFFLDAELRTSTITGLEHMDLNATGGEEVDALRPDEGELSTIYSSGGGWSVGLWDLPSGTWFNCSLEGNGSRFYFITEDNMGRMEHGSIFEYDPVMSVLDPPGTRSAVLEGGLYMVVTDSTAAEGESRDWFFLDYPS